MAEGDYRQFRDRVEDRAQIVEVVGSYVELTANPPFKGLCPFHTEKTASFCASEERGTAHCFGCNWHGNVFDFIMKKEGIEFWDSVLFLADRYDIPVPEFGAKDKEKADEEEKVRSFLARYVEVSHKQLLKNPKALEYVRSRGITDESIEEYQIGVGISIRKPELRKQAISAGLISVKDGREYQLEAGRLIFPITRHGKVLQIAGRTLKGEEPKYMCLKNTGFTPRVPMGSSRPRARECVLVEGPIDLILLEQVGIPACAVTGTAFQAEWLRWFGKETRLVLAYDADVNEAGQNANLRVGATLFEAGHTVDVIELPEGHDPASYVQANGGEAFESLMAMALPYITYWIRRQTDEPLSHQLQKVLQAAYGLIARVDRGIRGQYLKELKAKYKLSMEDLRNGLGDWLRANGQQFTPDPSMPITAGKNGHQRAAENDDRPIIYADCEDMPRVQRQCWEAVRAENEPTPKYFRQGRVPIRLVSDDNGVLVSERWTEKIARHELSEIIDWRKTVRPRNGTPYDVVSRPPDVQVQNMLAVPDVPLPVLSGITEVPVVAPDGSLQLTPGYHEASGMVYEPTPGLEIPPVNDKPSDEEMARAKEIFEDIVCDFPFKAMADKSHAAALWLLPFARRMIHGPTPMHMVEAPIPGTGKSLLMDVLLGCSVGRHMGTITEARDDDEWRKRLTALLVRGQMVVKLDNVSRMLDSGVLASALVEPVWQERLLGGNVMVDVPINCIWCCTANNPGMTTEIARRCIRIRIDPMRDKPWERGGFRHEDLRTYCEEIRGEMVWAALTLIRAWVARGRRPFSGRVIGSYEEWTRKIGGIIECAGFQDFLANYVEFLEQADSEGSAWRAFVNLWWKEFGPAAVGVAQLFPLAEESNAFTFGKDSEQGKRSAMGRRLKKMRDRVIGRFRVMAVEMKEKTNQWRLDEIEPDDGSSDTDGEMPEMPVIMDEVEDPFGEEE